MSQLQRSRVDTLAEYRDIPDTGCEFSPTCLACPQPVCKYDDPEWIRQSCRDRDNAICEAAGNGEERADLAKRHNISVRTVYRIIDRGWRKKDVLDEPPELSLSELGQRAYFRAHKQLLPLPVNQ